MSIPWSTDPSSWLVILFFILDHYKNRNQTWLSNSLCHATDISLTTENLIVRERNEYTASVVSKNKEENEKEDETVLDALPVSNEWKREMRVWERDMGKWNWLLEREKQWKKGSRNFIFPKRKTYSKSYGSLFYKGSFNKSEKLSNATYNPESQPVLILSLNHP